MPNPYHFRARIDRICRRAFGNGPGYLRLNALNTLVRELHARNDRARANYQMYLATDPYDVARHQLRELYDQSSPAIHEVVPAQREAPSEASLLPPLPLGEGGGEGSPDEDDDPFYSPNSSFFPAPFFSPHTTHRCRPPRALR